MRHTASTWRLSRRRGLQILASGAWPLLGTVAGVAQTTSPPTAANVLTFGADPSGERDSSEAFRRAIAQADVVTVPEGNFVVGDVLLRARLTLIGAGERSIIRHKPGARFALTCDSGSPDPAANLRAIALKNLQFRGSCDRDGFSEFVHLVSLNGVTDVVIEGVVFRGFRGDGLYLGSSNQARNERHNLNVAVRACTFDGINRENRNGISVIDCQGLTIENCRFVNVSRSNMPGAIDLEPDASPFHVIRNIRIANNSFQSIGGGVAAVSMYVPVQLDTMPADITIEGNTLEGIATTAFSLFQRVPLADSAAPQNLRIRNNRVTGPCQRPFVLRGVEGVEIDGNRFADATQSALIGNRDLSDAVRDVLLRGNLFERCGSAGGVAVAVFSASGLRFVDNEWRDCGNGKPTSYAVDFNLGNSKDISFVGNRFLSPSGRTAFAIQKEANHRFDPGSNEFAGNVVDARLRNAFEARPAGMR